MMKPETKLKREEEEKQSMNNEILSLASALDAAASYDTYNKYSINHWLEWYHDIDDLEQVLQKLPIADVEKIEKLRLKAELTLSNFVYALDHLDYKLPVHSIPKVAEPEP